MNHLLNINVSNDLDEKINNNFNSAKVLDVLVFLCREYHLDIEVIGGIISVNKYVTPETPKSIIEEKIPIVEYRKDIDFLSLDFKNDSLFRVVRELTNKTKKNVVIEPGIEDRKINVYIQNRPFKDALEKMCFANNLMIEEQDDFFMIRDLPQETKTAAKNATGRNGNNDSNATDPGTIEYSVNNAGLITVKTKNANLYSIIEVVSEEVHSNYFIYTEPEGEISLYIEDVTYDQFLIYLLHGTDYSFSKQDEVYLIGLSNEDVIRTTELVPLNNRTIENLLNATAGRQQTGRNTNNSNGSANNSNNQGNRGRLNGSSINSKLFSSDLMIEPFPELNSFIVSGPYPQVKLFKEFIHEIDQVVPVIMIEVILVDVNRNRSMQAGINAGLGDGVTPGSTTGPLSGEGGLNVDLSTAGINELLQSFNGLGIVNLGNVSPNFYLSIHALETDGVLKTRSVPKLATLNSYTAVLSNGRQEYYLETRTNVNSSASNNVLSEQQIWQPIEANLTVEITPVVSGAGQVTLQVSVVQSSFTERSGANGPFGKVNREFMSSIRVKDGEMILLGGLEENSIQDSGSGLPFLMRIPIIKWFFGSRTRAKKKSQLNIFIRPTILY